MDISAVAELITNIGFPIVCVLGLAWFVYTMLQRLLTECKANMESVQAQCKEREDKLYDEVTKNREINAQAIATIALYAEKLDVIQSDISDIKTNITVIKTKQLQA